MPMYLNSSTVATASMLFTVPHRSNPWTAKKLEKRFPHLADEMNGRSQDSQLLFYYKLNVAEKIFEFIDPDAEEDFAEVMGVDVGTFEEPDEESAPPNAPLSEEQLRLHHENISMIREGLAKVS